MLKPLSSFSTGELDPALRERTTLQKYESGLSTARNIFVRKTGGSSTAAGTKYLDETKTSGRKVILHDLSTFKNGYFLEFGHQYIRIKSSLSYNGQVFPTLESGQEAVSPYSESDLQNIQCENGPNGIVYVFCIGFKPYGVKVTQPGAYPEIALLASTDLFFTHPAPISMTSYTVSGAGYEVEYAITQVFAGEESKHRVLNPSPDFKLPVASGQSNRMVFRLIATGGKIPTEVRVYRRPLTGQAFGFIGFSTVITSGGGYYNCTFTDYGQEADYTHQFPSPNPHMVKSGITEASDIWGGVGLIYQQRLLMVDWNYDAASIQASRVGYLNNFYRDYPYASDSSLSLGVASSGDLRIRRLMDADGLLAFTTHGVFTQGGVMSPNNLALTRRGPWVIDRRVPPVFLPGAVVFYDESANCIRQLQWSESGAVYLGLEISLYSDHLFVEKRVVSMAYTNDGAPLLWVVFHDGTFCSLTFDREQEMRAWTRHDYADGVLKVEYVIGTEYFNHPSYGPQISKPIFVVANAEGDRFIEMGVPRKPRVEMKENDPEYYMGETAARMHSMVSFRELLNELLDPGDYFELTPVTPDDWEGELTLTCGTSEIFTDPGIGEVGTIFRWFDPVTRESLELEVVSRTDDDEVVVQPSREFPSEYAKDFRLYNTLSTLTGLDHMEGEKVAVMGDGYVIASPNNDDEDYPELTVVSGSITLPPEVPPPAIVHVGRPFTSDLETLSLATVEQKPTLIEPITVNKLYVKVQETRGLYVGANFPDDNKVEGMERPQVIDCEPMTDGNILANQYQRPVSKRYEITLPGDWDRNGRICARVVDPLHAEILSIIPDAEANLRRGD